MQRSVANRAQVILSLSLQHRTGDFAFIVDGVLGILEQQMASINNMLPGSRRSVPYIVDTSEYGLAVFMGRDLTEV